MSEDSGVTKVDLPSGGWAALKDPKHVTVRQRKPILAVMGRATSGEVALLDDMLVAGTCALVAQWSYGDISEDAVLDLPSEDANALQVAIMPLLSQLVPDLSADGAGDPQSPTPA